MRNALAPCLVMALCLPAAALAEDQKESLLSRGGLTFDFTGEARYDDNILQLSDRDIQRLADNPTSTRFRITQPDDMVAHTEFDVRWAHKIFPRRETRFSAGVDFFRYQTNTIKDWNEYRVGIVQELTASRKHLVVLRLGSTWMSDYYLRELTDDAASFAAGFRIRRSARYDQASPSASVGWEIIDDRLTVSTGYERSQRDYLRYFDERDGVRTDWSLEGRGRPFKRWRFELLAGLGAGDYDARGDLSSTPFPDDDISYDHDRWWARAAFPWGSTKRGRVEAEVEEEKRDYTTSNAFDLFHFGRTDHRREGSLRMVQRLGRGLELSAEWRYLTNDATFAAGVVPKDDVTDYDENRFMLGLRYRLGAQ